ncbi:MAG: twin-arginine translocation signal domain-containing protein [Xanthomonadaceae bacterium]|nr:twin-arginine translocation signal domain-containing protein [Xanthomonadaceae bacterium]
MRTACPGAGKRRSFPGRRRRGFRAFGFSGTGNPGAATAGAGAPATGQAHRASTAIVAGSRLRRDERRCVARAGRRGFLAQCTMGGAAATASSLPSASSTMRPSRCSAGSAP